MFRTTGGKHKYIVGDCNYLIADSLTAFHQQAALIADLPWPQIEAMRRIGSESESTAPRWRSRKKSASQSHQMHGMSGLWQAIPRPSRWWIWISRRS